MAQKYTSVRTITIGTTPVLIVPQLNADIDGTARRSGDYMVNVNVGKIRVMYDEAPADLATNGMPMSEGARDRDGVNNAIWAIRDAGETEDAIITVAYS
jgi:hypothetical protein